MDALMTLVVAFTVGSMFGLGIYAVCAAAAIQKKQNPPEPDARDYRSYDAYIIQHHKWENEQEHSDEGDESLLYGVGIILIVAGFLFLLIPWAKMEYIGIDSAITITILSLTPFYIAFIGYGIIRIIRPFVKRTYKFNDYD